jgi:hypothetical protein
MAICMVTTKMLNQFFVHKLAGYWFRQGQFRNISLNENMPRSMLWTFSLGVLNRDQPSHNEKQVVQWSTLLTGDNNVILFTENCPDVIFSYTLVSSGVVFLGIVDFIK